MKVGIDAHFVGVRHGGNEHHFENVIRSLAGQDAAGDEFYLFNYEGRGRGLLPGDAPFRIVPLKRRSVFLQRGLEIPGHDRRLGLDVLHVPFNVLPVGKSKKVVTIHDLAFLQVGETFGRAERMRMSLLTSLSARKADHIFAVSEYSRRDIIRHYGVPEAKISLTYNAVDEAVFRPWPEAEREAFRGELRLPPAFLLFVGTLQPRKNVLNLLRAYHRMSRGGRRDVHLVLVGRKGWIYADIFRLIGELGLAERVLHLESVGQRELAGLYNTALALVFPSFFEGFGMPILEAMCCGCPVTSSHATSMPEIYGDAALPFDPADVAAMADCMARMAEEPALRGDLAAKGRVNARRFSWDDTAAAIRKVYRSL